MEPGNPIVVFGKPRRKYQPSILNADDDPDASFKSESVKIESPVKLPAPEPKTLLEQANEDRLGDSAPVNRDEHIGVDKRLLLSALSSSKDTGAISSDWTPYSYVQSLPPNAMTEIRRQLKIIVEGSNIPPLALNFKDMRLPESICEYLKNVKKITTPSLIQMQGIPAALSGRDIVGIASTGSGKTFAFCLPLILFALEAELKLELAPGEGPISLILAPSVSYTF